jgi:hypothetical protein
MGRANETPLPECLGEEGCEARGSDAFDRSTEWLLGRGAVDIDLLSVENECNLLSPRYLLRHAQTALLFIFLFGISALLVSLVRESLRILIFTALGGEVQHLVLTVENAELVGSLPEGGEWWWYPLALLGPHLFVDWAALVVLLASGPRGAGRTFLTGRVSARDLGDAAKMALGWFCALQLLGMTLFFPITALLYELIGIERASHLVLAWEAANLTAGAGGAAAVRLSVLFAGAALLAAAGLYLYSTRRRGVVT